jgi:integrase
MSRERSPLIIGEYWLEQRRDGRSPYWQIATYSETARSNVYRSTKRRDVEGAGEVLRAYEAAQRSTAKEQRPDEAELIPHLFNYLREHGPDVGRLDTIKSSFRAWIGFLMQDELGTGARIADIDKNMVARFRRWRMGEHSWEIEWSGGKTYRHASKGVSGKAVQRNIEDLRAALHHAEANHRFTAPKVASVSKNLRPKNPRPTFTIPELGAILGYAKADEENKGFYHELCLMLASGCRPGNALAFNPAEQWHGETMDLQPLRKDLTDKRAAVVPVIEPLKPILKAWKGRPHDQVKSRKTTWRTLRRVLGVTLDAYSIRTTVSTYLDQQGVPGAQISGITGHLPASRGIARTTGEHYLHYDPLTAKRAKAVLTQLFTAVQREAEKWAADHSRTTPVRGQPITLAKPAAKVQHLRLVGDGGR